MSQEQATPSYKFGAMRDWPGYFRSVEGKEPRETLVEAVSAMGSFEAGSRLAIDLGCGEGRDTEELIRRGWRVLALDGHPEGIDRVRARVEAMNAGDRLEARVQAFETLESLPACDLLNASFSLPFCPPGHFDRVWKLVVDAVRPGGLFAGQLFGDRHTWASIADRTHQTAGEARALLCGFELIRFDETEEDKQDFEGNEMHWHLFHVVARKR